MLNVFLAFWRSVANEALNIFLGDPLPHIHITIFLSYLIIVSASVFAAVIDCYETPLHACHRSSCSVVAAWRMYYKLTVDCLT